MHKLKLESLRVESFETTWMGVHDQGTVHGNAAAVPTQPNTAVAACSPSVAVACAPSYDIPCAPSVVVICPPPTQVYHCTYGCSYRSGCDFCWDYGETPNCPTGTA